MGHGSITIVIYCDSSGAAGTINNKSIVDVQSTAGVQSKVEVQSKVDVQDGG